MTTVAVTGGHGKLGRAVVTHLVDRDYDVVVLDRVDTPDGLDPRARFVRTDLTDFGQVLGALTGVDDRLTRIDAVVHLAAIPAPGLVPNAALFANNMTASYHVFAAAQVASIHRIVWASSETVLGLPFSTPPPYLPVDEHYAARPESTYSLGKHLEETMAVQWCRWNPRLVATGLRFSNVMEPHDYAAFPGFDADPRSRSWNLWGYIDARDGAQAVRLGLERDDPGAEVFVIANADTVMSRSSASLAAEVFPGVEVRKSLGEHETLLSIDKARRVLGYEPQYSWRDKTWRHETRG